MDKSRLERAADAELFTGEELDTVYQISIAVVEYIEKARPSIKFDGGVMAGIDHTIRSRVLPLLAKRPKELLDRLHSSKGKRDGGRQSHRARNQERR